MRFPTFVTLLEKLPQVMEASAYSADTKGDYTGALVTRVQSLTNGINGQIFCAGKELSAEKLFDENVIVDLSRIGSTETKSLLMGILMIKLQEYRMAQAKGSNAKLEHITVLEEAHNLLRKTSTEQAQEGANLQGKSVEMLANAIAEMRTYGEGFIIADQSPGLLDMSVIRNTNTKIIMRLPDQSDRELVGKAAGLNENQIIELAKLDVGVAAVSQNHWLEPVLCKVAAFEDRKPFHYDSAEFEAAAQMDDVFMRILGKAEDSRETSDEEVDQMNDLTRRLHTGSGAKEILMRALKGEADTLEKEIPYALYCLVKGKTLLQQMDAPFISSSALAYIDQQISDMLQISEDISREIRQQIFAYAADNADTTDEQFLEYLKCGRAR